VPWREIWVYSPRVEGIHLRGGPVARGGLRWSDRRDDFRTDRERPNESTMRRAIFRADAQDERFHSQFSMT
jgi:hypothetical protein